MLFEWQGDRTEDKSKRTILITSILSLALLLGAVMIFVVVLVTYSTPSGLILTSDDEVTDLLLAAIMVAASALVGIGVVAAATRGLDERTRAVRRRSIDSLLCLLAIVLISAPLSVVTDTSDGSRWPLGECPGIYDYSTCVGRPLSLTASVLLFALVPLLLVGVSLAIGAVSAGLSRAAKANSWGGLAAILVYLVGSLVVAVAAFLPLEQNRISDPHTQFALGTLVLSPFLTSVVTLIYSFFGRTLSKST
jgi:hypothetical protein